MFRLAQQQISAEDLYDLSLKLEPREKPKHQKQERETGISMRMMRLDVLRNLSQ